MTLPASGAISLGQVNTELGRSATANIGMNETAVRSLFVVSTTSGVSFSMSDGYGDSAGTVVTVSGNQTNLNLRTYALANGWAGSVALTVNSAVTISSNAVGTAGLTIDGSFPAGVTFNNTGYVLGMGGAGGNGDTGAGSGVGSAGGLALSVSSAVTINNTSGTVGGGGGGGGGGGRVIGGGTYEGGGGGGGRTGSTGSTAGTTSGGATNGTAGSFSAAGGGGAGDGGLGGNGGAGGGWGTAGAAGLDGDFLGGAAGAAGAAVTGNSNVTWTANGTRLGAIS